jgi:hypothetical protein
VPPLLPEQLVIPAVPPYVLHRVGGALEGEDLSIRSVEGTVDRHELEPPFSAEALLSWKPARIGSRLVVDFPVADPGRYKLFARFAASPDSGTHQIEVNGEDTPALVDLYAPTTTTTAMPELLVGAFHLDAGVQTFSLRAAEPNERSHPKHHIAGLDYLRLEKLE